MWHHKSACICSALSSVTRHRHTQEGGLVVLDRTRLQPAWDPVLQGHQAGLHVLRGFAGLLHVQPGVQTRQQLAFFLLRGPTGRACIRPEATYPLSPQRLFPTTMRALPAAALK